jgi:hypothetical protein
VLVARDDAELRAVLLGLQNRRPPLTGQIFEAVGVEQRLVELAPLLVAHLRQRRVADDLLDATAELRARPP